jgi:sterol desaturase/sphingolipid hydroxylase (fatty acid hydroxylase superfamily)
MEGACMEGSMQLSKPGYYADFVVYPVLIGALAVAGAAKGGLERPLTFVALCLVGIAAWTLFEYLLHRFLLHEVPILRDLHDEHHHDPTALAGTPSWLSLTIGIIGIMAPLWWLFGFERADALMTGILIGYLAYISVHHITHHWRLRPGGYLYELKHRHNRHHFSKVPGNFGVTTLFWDTVFGTRLDKSTNQRPRQG